MIPFNKPLIIGNELKYIKKVLINNKLSGDGPFNNECSKLLEKQLKCQKVLLTPSGTAALELAAILSDIKKGDEVIMPSFTFPSTANAFVLRGATIVFVDICPQTMNIDASLIEAAITKKTKAIVPVHYGGVSCDMSAILAIARKYHLLVIEDSAQGILGAYKAKPLGTFGELGCLSFHETKNITCGEGGALIINDKKLITRAEIIREKGTERAKFLRGEVNKYTWVDIGSSYLLNEISSAYLLTQLKDASKVIKNRLKSWNLYYKLLSPLAKENLIELPTVSQNCQHNGHIFYIKVKNFQERSKLINFLKQQKIMAVTHYVPLHSAKAGKLYGRFNGVDHHTTIESERILRLPLFYGLKAKQIKEIADYISKFFQKK